MDKIIPINDQVLVQPFEAEKPEGIELPDILKKEPSRGTVLRVAANVTEVAPGDKIEWKELSGIYADDLILVSVSDILYRFS